ncbi:MAG: hypothetical protein ACOCT9_03195 [archaeon]
MELNEKCFEDLVYSSEYGDKEIVKEEFGAALKKFKSETRFLQFIYSRELCKEDFENINLGFKYSNFDTYRKRLKDKNLIRVSRLEDKKEYLVLTNIGIETLKKYIKTDFIDVNDYVLENIREHRKQKEEISLDKEKNLNILIKEVFSLLNNKPNIQRAIQKGGFEFDLDEIGKLNPIVLDNILENFEETLELFKNSIEEYLSIEDKNMFHKIRDNIKFNKLDNYKTQIYRIHKIPKQNKEFIAVKGLLTKKNSKLKDEVYNIFYMCSNPTCEYNQDYIRTGGQEIKACPKCKSPVEEMYKEMKSCLNLELSDLETESSINVKAYDSIKDELNKVKVGEEITIYGHINYIKDKSYTKELEDKSAYDRVLVVNNFYENNNADSLREEDKKEVEDVFRRINDTGKTIEEYLLEPFEGQFPYPNELNRMILIPQFQKYSEAEDIIHTLLVGSSGCGKSTYIRNLCKIFPKSHQIEMKQLSEAKFYGGVKNDKITDLGICMKQKEGTLVLDEVDKDEDSYYKGSHMLNEVLGSQTATKEKVGVSIKLTNINLRVIGIMNPDPEKILDTMKWVNKNFHDSTVNRFFIINLDYFFNNEIENQIDKNYFEGNLKKIDEYRLEERKKVILYLRNIDVDCSDIIDDMVNFQKGFKKLPLNYFESTTRNIRHLKNIVIGTCKLKGKKKAEFEDLEEAKNLLTWTLKTKGEDLTSFLEPETIECQNINK